jgi:hypothetical protein
VHQHPKADDSVERTIAEVQGMGIASVESNGETFVSRAFSRDGEHGLGRVYRCDRCPLAGKEERRSARPGSDIEDPAAGHRPQKLRQRLGLRSRHQRPYRTAEAAIVKGLRSRRIGIDRIAVVIFGRSCGHARSLAAATVGAEGKSAEQTRRVRSRYAS